MAEIDTMVTLSLKTIDEDTHDMLVEMGEDVEDRPHFGDWRDRTTRLGTAYGHFVRVPEALDGETLASRIEGMPDSLKAGMLHAGMYGARWIYYDRDAEEHGLRRYHW